MKIINSLSLFLKIQEKLENFSLIFKKLSKKLKNKKTLFLFISAIFSISIIALLFPLRFAHAAWYEAIIKTMLMVIVALVTAPFVILGYVIQEMASLILQLLTDILKWAALAKIGGYSLTQPANNPFIKAGLDVTMPLANMAFILIFVTIAIATILGIESYGVKKILPVLIIVALLVNFAPVLVGFMVDAANVIVAYFIKGIDFSELVTPNTEMLAHFFKAIARSFHTTMAGATPVAWLKYALVGSCVGDPGCSELRPGEKWNDGKNDPTDFFGIMLPFLYLIGVSLAMLLASLSIVIMTGLFIARNLAIWLLVILAPIAFAAYVLPSTKNVFKKWWTQLLQWAFIGVTACFFLYLASVLSSVSKNMIVEKYQQGETSVKTETNIERTIPKPDSQQASEQEQQGFLEAITNMLVQTAFPCMVILIGLMASVKSGGAFANYVVKQAGKAGKWTAGLSGGALAFAGIKGMGAIEKGVVGKEGSMRYKMWKRFERAPGVRKVIKLGSITGARAKQISKQSEEMKDYFEAKSSDDLKYELASIKSFHPKNAARADRIINTLTKRGDLSEKDSQGKKVKGLDLAAVSRKLSQNGMHKTVKDAQKRNPLILRDASGNIDRKRLENLIGTMSTEDKTKMNVDAFENPQIVGEVFRSSSIKEIETILSNKKIAKNVRGVLTRGVSPNPKVNVRTNVMNFAENREQANQIMNALKRNKNIRRKIGNDLA